MADTNEGVSPKVQRPRISVVEKQKILLNVEKAFNYRRRIEIQGVPRSFSKQDIGRILLCNLSFDEIYISRDDRVHVLLTNPQQAAIAMRQLEGKMFDGKKLFVCYSQSTFLLFVGNLPYTYNVSKFRELMELYGTIERIFIVHCELTGYSKGYGFVEYLKKTSADRAKQEFNQTIEGRTLRIDFANYGIFLNTHVHSNTLFVDKFPPVTTSDQIKELFNTKITAEFCQIAQNPLTQKQRNFALVDFSTSSKAESAWLELDGAVVNGKPIRISFSSPARTGASIIGGMPNNTPQLQNVPVPISIPRLTDPTASFKILPADKNEKGKDPVAPISTFHQKYKSNGNNPFAPTLPPMNYSDDSTSLSKISSATDPELWNVPVPEYIIRESEINAARKLALGDEYAATTVDFPYINQHDATNNENSKKCEDKPEETSTAADDFVDIQMSWSDWGNLERTDDHKTSSTAPNKRFVPNDFLHQNHQNQHPQQQQQQNQYQQYNQQPPPTQYQKHNHQPPSTQYQQYNQQPPPTQYQNYNHQPPSTQYQQYNQQPPLTQYQQYNPSQPPLTQNQQYNQQPPSTPYQQYNQQPPPTQYKQLQPPSTQNQQYNHPKPQIQQQNQQQPGYDTQHQYSSSFVPANNNKQGNNVPGNAQSQIKKAEPLLSSNYGYAHNSFAPPSTQSQQNTSQNNNQVNNTINQSRNEKPATTNNMKPKKQSRWDKSSSSGGVIDNAQKPAKSKLDPSCVPFAMAAVLADSSLNNLSDTNHQNKTKNTNQPAQVEQPTWQPPNQNTPSQAFNKQQQPTQAVMTPQNEFYNPTQQNAYNNPVAPSTPQSIVPSHPLTNLPTEAQTASNQYVQYYQQYYASTMANVPGFDMKATMDQVTAYANQYYAQYYSQNASGFTTPQTQSLPTTPNYSQYNQNTMQGQSWQPPPNGHNQLAISSTQSNNQYSSTQLPLPPPQPSNSYGQPQSQGYGQLSAQQTPVSYGQPTPSTPPGLYGQATGQTSIYGQTSSYGQPPASSHVQATATFGQAPILSNFYGQTVTTSSYSQPSASTNIYGQYGQQSAPQNPATHAQPSTPTNFSSYGPPPMNQVGPYAQTNQSPAVQNSNSYVQKPAVQKSTSLNPAPNAQPSTPTNFSSYGSPSMNQVGPYAKTNQSPAVQNSNSYIQKPAVHKSISQNPASYAQPSTPTNFSSYDPPSMNQVGPYAQTNQSPAVQNSNSYVQKPAVQKSTSQNPTPYVQPSTPTNYGSYGPPSMNQIGPYAQTNQSLAVQNSNSYIQKPAVQKSTSQNPAPYVQPSTPTNYGSYGPPSMNQIGPYAQTNQSPAVQNLNSYVQKPFVQNTNYSQGNGQPQNQNNNFQGQRGMSGNYGYNQASNNAPNITPDSIKVVIVFEGGWKQSFIH